VGIFIGWFVRSRWFLVAGFVIVLLALFMPWPNGVIGQIVLWLGIAVMAVQLVVIARVTSHRPRPTDPD
jgi:di/tricarboxylate transporter